MKKEQSIPKFLWLIGFVEIWERFSYYGMRCLLVLYLTSFLSLADSTAYSIYALFGTFAYVGAVMFGYISDKFLGARNSVIIGSLVMLVGHLFMALSHKFDPSMVYLAISLICIGTSIFKGNMSSMLGLCYNGTPYNRDTGYTVFYVCVNIGSFFSTIICGYLGQNWGWEYGFGIAGLGLLLGTMALVTFQGMLGEAGKMPEKYRTDATKTITLFLIGVAIYCVLFSWVVSNSDYVMSPIIYGLNSIETMFILVLGAYFYQIYQDTEHRKSSVILVYIMFFVSFFFLLELQLGGLLKLFTNRNVDLDVYVLGYKLEASMLEAINPGTIMIFGALAGNSKMKDNENSLYRFLFGLSCIPACFAILLLGCYANIGGLVAFSYVFFGYLVMAIGEIFVGPFYLSQTSKLANPNRRGLTFGFSSFFIGFANLLGGKIAKKYFSVNTELVDDKVVTLGIYQEGFMKVVVANLIVIAIFILFLPMLKKAYKEVTQKKSEPTPLSELS